MEQTAHFAQVSLSFDPLCHLIPDFAAAAVAGENFSSPQDAQKSVGDTSSNLAKMHCTCKKMLNFSKTQGLTEEQKD